MIQLLQDHMDSIMVMNSLLGEKNKARYVLFTNGVDVYPLGLTIRNFLHIEVIAFVDEILVRISLSESQIPKMLNDSKNLENFNRIEDRFIHKDYIYKFRDFERFKIFFDRIILG